MHDYNSKQNSKLTTLYLPGKLFSKLITEIYAIYAIHANTFQFFTNYLLLYIKVQ